MSLDRSGSRPAHDPETDPRETERDDKWLITASNAAPLTVDAVLSGTSAELTTTEDFLNAWDTPNSPIVIRVRMVFSGHFDLPLFESTFADAVARQPMLRATLQDSRWSSTTTAHEFSVHEAEPPDRLDGIDLRSQPGIRARLYLGQRSTEPEAAASDGLIADVDVHHACCDGQGIRYFLLDWFALYTAATEGRAADDGKLTDLDAARLIDRAELTNPATIPPPTPREALRNFWLTVRGRTARIKAEADDLPALRDLVLDKTRTAAINAAMKSAGCTINDLGTATTFVAASRLAGRGRVSVAVPVDLRKPSDRQTPSCNKIGFAFARYEKAVTIAAILPAINDQMRYVKDGFIGAEFIRALEMVRGAPFILHTFRRLGLLVPTAQFTCLGNVTRGTRHRVRRDADKALAFETEGRHGRLEIISGFAPLGPHVPLSVGQCETAGAMTFSVVAANTEIAVRAVHLMDEALREWVAAVPETPTDETR